MRVAISRTFSASLDFYKSNIKTTDCLTITLI
ncbi:hypothetical protein AEQU1_01548 [Aequorivita sp. CIP111184]|nr:hypothetical protein AEQU1_01548 [Aequorivita sp. CIP111184]